MDHLKLFNNHSDYETFVSSGAMVKPNVSYCREQVEVHYNPTLNWVVKTKYYIDDISVPTVIAGATLYSGVEGDGLEFVEKVIVDGVEIEIPEPTYGIGYRYQFDSVGLHEVDYVMKQTMTDYVMDETTGDWVEVEVPLEGCTISFSMFDWCWRLVELNLPNSVINVNSGFITPLLSSITIDNGNSFYDSRNNCNAIIETSTNKLIKGSNNTVIPNGVVEIKNKAFASNDGLTNITIPSSMTTIGDQVFDGCENLLSIRSLAATAPTITNRTFLNVAEGGVLSVPTGSTGYNTWMNSAAYYLGNSEWTMIEE